jgi:broad specificity phosphatase PhoE
LAIEEGRDMSTYFILLRHGQTEWNREQRFRGRADLSLDEIGLRQAEAVAEKLTSYKAAVIYSSPLPRALMTAQVVAEHLGLTVQTLPELIDIDFGDWEGLSAKEASEQDSDLFNRWTEHPHEVRFPQGESLQDVRDRVAAAVESLALKHDGQTVALISHKVVCQVLICLVLGLDDSHFWQVGQDVAAINVFAVSGDKAMLILLNDTCHLKHLGLHK